MCFRCYCGCSCGINLINVDVAAADAVIDDVVNIDVDVLILPFVS